MIVLFPNANLSNSSQAVGTLSNWHGNNSRNGALEQ